MKLKILSFITCIFLTTSFFSTAYATSQSPNAPSAIQDISPYWHNIAKVKTQLTISPIGKAQISCYIFGYTESTSKVKIQADLQQYRNGRWYTIQTFLAERNANYVLLDDTCAVPKGFDYRISTVFTAYNGAVSETTTQISNVCTYK